MQHTLYISEQHKKMPLAGIKDELKLILLEEVYAKVYPHKKDMFCFQLFNQENNYSVDTNYFIGIDWLVFNKAAVYVEPKLNDETGERQINFLGMLISSLEAPENLNHLDGLFSVDYEKPWISIPQQKDLLSPILIVQFLKLVQKIVRKGLKKSYYRVTQNLDSRIKGKILVGAQIKENIVKNRFTKTVCNYQEFGIDILENQFIKLVLQFVATYLNQKNRFFNKEQTLQMLNILHYCQPAFEHVKQLEGAHHKIHAHKNVFYKDYEEAIRIGGYILKRFSFNINKTSEVQTSTPPFWIDMSKLFELYVFGKLKKEFPETDAISYHDTYLGGKETDILIRKDGYKCVIDCKYKPQYENNTPSLEDKRQLAGYTRLESVYKKLDINSDKIVKGLIIYSHQDCKESIDKEELLKTPMGEYVDFYKLGVKLLVIT